ncbi:Eco57I restriction-modification methylase domain-containing protein [Flavobacterium sp.]|uniref:Eco57I restriction-modification methylase domain-containing protein n=1 Tax=Flavobacterium sp. TaxID=239 RepID=UPI0039E234DF
MNEESVEIAKLSLWLRTAQPKRKLTSLNNNIKRGNSLVDNKAVAGAAAFNWKENFPEVFEAGGFDVIIGNPPYVPTEYIEAEEKKYLEKTYQSAFGRINLYPIFYEKGIQILRPNGVLGFITPYTILKNQYYKEARKYIIENSKIIEIIDFKGISVFEDAAVDSIILLLEKNVADKYVYRQISKIVSFENEVYTVNSFNISEILKSPDLSMLSTTHDKLIKNLSKDTIPLKDIVDFKQGIITGGNSKFITTNSSPLTKKVVTGSDFNKYSFVDSGNLIVYDIVNLHRPRKPEIFEASEKILLRQTASYPICTLDTKQFYTLDTVHNGLLINNNFSLKFILALLNSKLLRFLYESQINEGGKVFAQVKIIYVDPLPIPKLTLERQLPFIEAVDSVLQANTELQVVASKFNKYIVSTQKFDDLPKKLESWYQLTFEDFLLEIDKHRKSLKLPSLTMRDKFDWLEIFDENKQKANKLKLLVDNTLREIDDLVYKLYGLDENEISQIND